MTKAVVAVADQILLQELRSRLEQIDTPIEIASVAESTHELASVLTREQPTLLFVHDRIGPGAVLPMIRDLTMRNPALAVLMITSSHGQDAYQRAIEMGARGVLVNPFGLEELEQRIGTALEWARAGRSVPLLEATAGRGSGRVVTVTGAKGGVGVSVIASHLAWDIATQERDMRVCLVDLDVEKGDVPSYLDVAHRVSIADLAKISEDLSPRAVADTVLSHASGLNLLLAPIEIRDTEYVTAEAVRRIVEQLRSMYHLVIIDAGAAVTAAQAAAVQSADVVQQVVTADVPALRAARRQVLAWESLGVVNPGEVRIVVNRFDRRSEIQQDTIDTLVLGERSQVLIPDLDQGLARASNTRTPSEVRNGRWWKSLRAIGQELDVVRAYRESAADASDGDPGQQPVAAGRRAHDAGQITLETAALIPLALVALVVCIQMILLGMAFVWSGVASSAAARAVSVGDSPPQVAARATLPPGFDAEVTQSGNRISVRVDSPLLLGTGVQREIGIETRHTVQEEPR
ncbi:pilus assembly protein CpaE [Naumannella cuiyingiana]|uniref:Pilus assembly protein CpaE n=1 Tax=Naumannella cuiyingiana TaxID=1347891 RepID=A0A7Z0IKT5_9ACTN|nr:cellulose synthase operon protein YhjQ/BcsQ [Naumannella cuiyingiana]NYI70866.1 pilus assembly protein CpaE [Naumannella cuiyingiana]